MKFLNGVVIKEKTSDFYWKLPTPYPHLTKLF